jgi:hypothetical protein
MFSEDLAWTKLLEEHVLKSTQGILLSKCTRVYALGFRDIFSNALSEGILHSHSTRALTLQFVFKGAN